jgi:two-component system response regulator FlrC
LQERVVERVGSHQEIALDFRLVAATNRRLEQAVREGRFREDLYFRIGVFPLEIPPLRTRIDDIEVLARHFLKRYSAPAGRPGARLSDAALVRMRRHPWPGNVRELENVIQRALLMADTDDIMPDDLGLPAQMANPGVGAVTPSPQTDLQRGIPLGVQMGGLQPSDLGQPIADSAGLTNGPFSVQEPRTAADGQANTDAGGAQALVASTPARDDAVDIRSIEREHILQVLRTVNGSRRRAVELLGISERALRYKLKSYRDEGHTVS